MTTQVAEEFPTVPPPSLVADAPEEEAESLNLLEVAPGIMLPLKPIQETWSGIREGRINITICIQCQDELTCVDDLRFVVCGDCWTLNPVDRRQQQRPGNGDDDDDDDDIPLDPTKDFIGLGVKNTDIVAWMEGGCRSSFSK
jgi:hypothetical protein